MAKTAEEILNDKSIHFSSALQVHLVHTAMYEWGDLRAAQEVEAYKVRIKAAFTKEIDGNDPGFIKMHIHRIIDAVK